MKIMILDKRLGIPGTYGGAIQLGMLIGDIPLNDRDIAKTRGFGHSGERNSEYVISLRDELWVTTLPRSDNGFRPSYFKLFTLGEARATVSEVLDNGDRRAVKISIESPNSADFVSLYKSVYEDWLGIPHETIPVPSYRMQEPSFIRGIRNDLRDLRQYLKNRWRRTNAMTIGQTA